MHDARHMKPIFIKPIAHVTFFHFYLMKNWLTFKLSRIAWHRSLTSGKGHRIESRSKPGSCSLINCLPSNTSSATSTSPSSLAFFSEFTQRWVAPSSSFPGHLHGEVVTPLSHPSKVFAIPSRTSAWTRWSRVESANQNLNELSSWIWWWNPGPLNGSSVFLAIYELSVM